MRWEITKKKLFTGESQRWNQATSMGDFGVLPNGDDYCAAPFELDSESEDEPYWYLLQSGTLSGDEYNKQRENNTGDREELKDVALRHGGSMCGTPTIRLDIVICYVKTTYGALY